MVITPSPSKYKKLDTRFSVSRARMSLWWITTGRLSWDWLSSGKFLLTLQSLIHHECFVHGLSFEFDRRLWDHRSLSIIFTWSPSNRSQQWSWSFGVSLRLIHLHRGFHRLVLGTQYASWILPINQVTGLIQSSSRRDFYRCGHIRASTGSHNMVDWRTLHWGINPKHHYRLHVTR